MKTIADLRALIDRVEAEKLSPVEQKNIVETTYLVMESLIKEREECVNYGKAEENQ